MVQELMRLTSSVDPRLPTVAYHNLDITIVKACALGSRGFQWASSFHKESFVPRFPSSLLSQEVSSFQQLPTPNGPKHIVDVGYFSKRWIQLSRPYS